MTRNPFRRMTWLAFVIPVLALLLAMPGTTYAQRMTGELNGTVVDESGGVIPGADVLLIDESSKGERRSVTNADGFFAFSAVPAGTYTIQISLQGFSTYEVTGIPLGAGDSRSLRDLPLKVAAMAETVSVTAEVQLTPLNSGEKSTTLTSEVIEDIPLVSSSAAEMLRLVPGMTALNNSGDAKNRPGFTGEVIGINGNGEYDGAGGNNQSAIGNYTANGTSPGSLDITIDGAPGADPGCNCATSINPNTEFVQEFKVLSSSFSAEYAKGPNSMTVVSKSGGRDFHGSAFLYFRDYRLNSNEWFANKTGKERVETKFTYPGFTFGGPLSFGGFNKDRDKVFFFVGYEYYKQKLPTGLQRTWVPTAANREGNFANQDQLGLTGDFVNGVPSGPSITNGVVNPGAIDPGGQILLNLYPQPNIDPATTGGYNWVENIVNEQPNHQFLTRLDFNMSDNTKMFVRYNLQRETQPFVYGLWWRYAGEKTTPYPTRVVAPNRSDSVTASLTHVFDPTLTSETILAFTYIDFPNTLENPATVDRAALGYPYTGLFGDAPQQIPTLDSGNWGSAGPAYYNPGGFDPVLYATKWQWAFTQNVTKVWGTHTAKFGFFWEYIRNSQPGSEPTSGRIGNNPWNGNSSGNTFADILQGQIADYYEFTKNPSHNIKWNRYELFAQDSWKMSPSFTLNVGARASLFEPWTDAEGVGLATWDQTRYQSDVDAGKAFPGVYWNAIDPSIPLAGVGNFYIFQPRVGMAWDIRGTGETVLRGGAGLYVYHDPQSVWAGLVDVGAGAKSWSRGGGNFTLADIDATDPDAAGTVFGGSAQDINAKDQPRTINWSLTLNQRLPGSMNIEIGYVGNKTNNVINNGLANYNAVPLGAMLNDPEGNNDAYRPLSAYGDLNVYQHTIFQNYHGLQAMLARQRGSFNFTLAYTFSKAMGIRGNDGRGEGLGSEYILSPYRAYSYGPLAYDRTHVATASFSWLLPEPSRDSGALYHVLGGWQLAGILSYVAGSPLPYFDGGSTNFNIQGTNAEGMDLGNSRMYSGTPNVPVMPIMTCNPAENIPDGYMLNPACFAAPSVGTNGNYNMPYMKGQSYNNVDLSVFKNFDLGGDKRLQLRVSAYNLFNHPIAYPDENTNLTLRFDNGVVSEPAFGWLPNEDSDKGGANKYGKRIVQLAVRFTF